MLTLLLSLLLLVQAPPRTRTDNVKEVIHGVEIVDPYRWLEDQDSPETRAWIDAQNAHSRPILDSLPAREALKRRLTELMKIDVTGMPRERGGRYFFSRKLASQDQYVIHMRKGLRGRDEVLIDPHPWSPDHTISVGLRDVSRDGKLIAYGVRRGGEDEVEIRLMDVDSRKDLQDRLAKGRYFGVSIKPDKSGFYYSRHGKEGSRIYYHAMGTDAAGDAELFGKGYGPDKAVSADLSDDGRYLVIHVVYGSSGDRSDIFYQDLSVGGAIQPLVKDEAAAFFGDVAGDRMFLRTNWKAPNWRVLAVDLKNPARANWREVIPEAKSVLEGLSLAGARLCASYLENVSSRVRIFDAQGKQVRDIAFPTLGTVRGPGGRWGSTEAFYAFSSFHVPGAIYRYDVASGHQEVWWKPNLPFRSDALELKQVWYASRDGTRIPMFLLHRKGLKLDGSHPALLTGYGGFNISETPSFRELPAVWAERGGVFALPNLRGGGEFGEVWHRAGMLDKKQNVFDDFIAAAEWLIKNGYTGPSRLAIYGGSNGGLLVGAAMTQRPELFRAVVCRYPLLDMVRFHRFFIARFWVSEYGSSEDAGQFKYLYAYSPYHHVKRGEKYPVVLFVTGDADTRVAPLHARKMAALVQASTGSDRPVLLKYEVKAGHSGGMPVTKRVDDLADELGFVLWQTGGGVTQTAR